VLTTEGSLTREKTVAASMIKEKIITHKGKERFESFFCSLRTNQRCNLLLYRGSTVLAHPLCLVFLCAWVVILAFKILFHIIPLKQIIIGNGVVGLQAKNKYSDGLYMQFLQKTIL